MTWHLHGTTELDADRWPELVADLGDWHAAWVDLDGVHVTETMPAQLPLTSHVWGWTHGGWLRVRADADRWWASILLRDEASKSAFWQKSHETVPTVIVDRITSWPAGDLRVAQLRRAPGTTIPGRMLQLVPVRPRPAAFIGAVDTLPDESA